MKRLVCFFIAIFVASPLSHGQQSLFSSSSYRESLSKSEMRRHAMLLEATQKPASDPNIDVTYYKLNLSITTSPNYLRGVVTIKAKSNSENLAVITLDLMNVLTVDSITTGGARLSFAQQTSTVTVSLDRSYASGEMLSLNIYYRGLPSFSLIFSSHSGMPWVWSSSEPDGARYWWPCKDHPSDKADSVDIWVTVDSTLKVGSNGLLARVVHNGNGTTTYQWAERYPISTYLVSVAVTDYAEAIDWFTYSPTDSMPVLHYVLPEHVAASRADLSSTVGMLRIYSDLFGLYPFIKEKYGHAEWLPGWGGMENQTMTSIDGFGSGIVSHELAHQWFGDMITMANWPHLWLNEGFAQYSTGLYYEKQYGTSSYQAYMDPQMAYAKQALGSIYIRDTSNIADMFAANRVYAKGASVLHMLRHVLGDSVFFRAIKAYAGDPRYRFGVATTEDFRNVCETISGKPLGYFFDEWIYGVSYPHYLCWWKVQPGSSAYDVTLHIAQQRGTTPAFFSMPMDIRLAASGWDTTVVFMDSVESKDFTIKSSHMPDTVQFDPQNWILRTLDSFPADKPYLTLSPTLIDFGPVNVNTALRDSTFILNNLGGMNDSVSVSVDPVNIVPDTAISVSPDAFVLPGGGSHAVRVRVRPRLMASGVYYTAGVYMNSRFSTATPQVLGVVQFNLVGTLGVTTAEGLPTEFSLAQNYPNPFNPSTTINYGLPKRSQVTLTVFNTLGQQVAILQNGELEAGYHEVKFDGSGLSSGVYFYRIQVRPLDSASGRDSKSGAGSFVQTRNLLLIR